MDIHASLRYLHMSPRKVRLVIDAVRGLRALEAQTRLQFIKKDASRPVLKLLQSAMANASHNAQMKKEDLFIKKITADGGPSLKRFSPRAFGRAAPIRKRTSHIEIVLGPVSEMKAKKVKKIRKASTSSKLTATSS
ncbi:50S ribosomal protein L22 [Candidatus Uhrbacteria bacterium]|nr:50S ribosomal protein L22 [Candidatus Uhrbacteria bacterium]